MKPDGKLQSGQLERVDSKKRINTIGSMREIRAPGGNVRGYLKEVGDRTELIAKGGRLLGFYDHTKNQTIASGGRVIGWGNQLMTLLED
jgi:hypothetical protein